MQHFETLREFEEFVSPLLTQPMVRAMDEIPQHAAGVSCLDHCLFVSYVSFLVCRRLGLNGEAAARAGLLHDLYLCDWRQRDVNPFLRLVIHPKMALENSMRFGLSDLEQDIILKHMWPVTIRNIPRHRESVVVNLVDKFCACAEMLRLYKRIKIGKLLADYNPCRPQEALQGA